MCAKKRAELLLNIVEDAEKPIYLQIYEQVRDAIFSGRVKEGERLTSIRRLASDLDISHTTVEQAYLQLATEGIVKNIPRSGYVVEPVDVEYLSLRKESDVAEVAAASSARSTDAFFAENKSGGGVRYDFSYANLQPDSFPANIWRKLTSEVLFRNDCPELARYTYTDEPSSLSQELAGLLSRTRGVRCSPEQVIPQAGTDGSLATVLQLFDRDHDVIGMEEPGYATMHEVARRHGFKMQGIPSDQGPDAFLDALEEAKPKLIFTTPSHQFPTGKLLPLDARTRLLRWAEDNDAYIIEDDSCNEFRYATRPIPSLQSLDAYGRVIYLCNISKVLSPSLRIAYLVLPPRLLERYWQAFNFAHPQISWLEQEVLARFIAEGHWDSHVRRVAHGNHQRSDELLRCLDEKLAGAIDISGADTGMHVYVTVNNGFTQAELLQTALNEGAKVYGTSRMWFSKPAPEDNVMVGFSSILLEDIEPGVDALARAWLSE